MILCHNNTCTFPMTNKCNEMKFMSMFKTKVFLFTKQFVVFTVPVVSIIVYEYIMCLRHYSKLVPYSTIKIAIFIN